MEFRLWGEPNDCKSISFKTFLKELPKDKPIIFDLSRGKFPLCFEKMISELKDKKEFYFYGSEKIKWIEKDIKNVKEAIEYSKDHLEKSTEEILVDKLLDSKSNEEILLEYIDIKNELNKKRIFLNRNEILKTIANNM